VVGSDVELSAGLVLVSYTTLVCTLVFNMVVLEVVVWACVVCDA